MQRCVCWQLVLTIDSFAGTGTVATVIAWFILPEVARRTPAEIDEMYVCFLVKPSSTPRPVFPSCLCGLHTKPTPLNTNNNRFNKRVPLRKFKGYVTEVQMRADQIHDKQDIVA